MIALDGPALAPAEAARRAARGQAAFWLSGPADDEVSIAFDAVGADPARVVRGASVAELEQAWAQERARWAETGAAPGPGVPIAAGWLSYDLGRALTGLTARSTGLPARGADAALAPFAPLEFHFHDAVWVRRAGGAAAILARDEAAARRLRALLEAPAQATPAATATPGALEPDHDARTYLDGARRVLDYLVAGDAYQVNLARRVSAPFDLGGDPGRVPVPPGVRSAWQSQASLRAVELAAALRARAPAPFGAFIASAAGDACLVGNSPERFLALDGRGAVETRPIKGTGTLRGSPNPPALAPPGTARLRSGRDELLSSEKDRAEHVMIVDLERNDLGRVCRTGSVRVDGPARVLELPTVLHLVSTVRGVLRPDVGLAALIEATFPGGSITGAPKRRAMEIIDELEPVARGPYTGATGWLGAAGDLDLAVAIRTALVSQGRLTLSLGGGIVADSTPENEFAETETKARAFALLCGGGSTA